MSSADRVAARCSGPVARAPVGVVWRMLMPALISIAPACSDDGASGPPHPSAEVVLLTPAEHLARASVALRGLRPSSEDLATVEADPSMLSTVVDRYMQSPQFGETIRELHNDSLLSVVDYFIYPAGFPPVGPLDGEDVYAMNRSVMEAPLRLIEHVVMNDRPYTEIVTADYTLANNHVAAVWGLPYSGNGEWVETRWSDGRDNAGILSDSWLYQRHRSTISNANRGRANAISRALLCYDFISRDIAPDASVDLADPAVVANAVVDNPTCASCHQTLDPLASFFRGFFPLRVPGFTQATCDPLPPQFASPEECEAYPLPGYYPDLFPDLLGVPMRSPVYFGTGGDEVRTLGVLISEDPRFSLCAAERFYAFFNQVGLEEVPFDEAAALQNVLVDSGMDAKALVKAIVLSDRFAASRADPIDPNASEIDPSDDVVGIKKVRPEQLARMVEALTGYRWRSDLSAIGGGDLPPYGLGNVDIMQDSFIGYQVLGGGIDGIFTTRPSHTFSATTSLVVRTLARLAAEHVVENDFGGGTRRLLALDEAVTDEASVRAQLVDLSVRMFSKRMAPNSPEIDSSFALWTSALQHSKSARRAWKITLTAMLQDVNFVYY